MKFEKIVLKMTQKTIEFFKGGTMISIFSKKVLKQQFLKFLRTQALFLQMIKTTLSDCTVNIGLILSVVNYSPSFFLKITLICFFFFLFIYLQNFYKQFFFYN